MLEFVTRLIFYKLFYGDDVNLKIITVFFALFFFQAANAGNIIAVLDCGKIDNEIFPEFNDYLNSKIKPKFSNGQVYSKPPKLRLEISHGNLKENSYIPLESEKIVQYYPTMHVRVVGAPPASRIGEVADNGQYSFGMRRDKNIIFRNVYSFSKFEYSWSDIIRKAYVSKLGNKYYTSEFFNWKDSPSERYWNLDRITGLLTIKTHYPNKKDKGKKIIRQCEKVKLLF